MFSFTHRASKESKNKAISRRPVMWVFPVAAFPSPHSTAGMSMKAGTGCRRYVSEACLMPYQGFQMLLPAVLQVCCRWADGGRPVGRTCCCPRHSKTAGNTGVGNGATQKMSRLHETLRPEARKGIKVGAFSSSSQ